MKQLCRNERQGTPESFLEKSLYILFAIFIRNHLLRHCLIYYPFLPYKYFNHHLRIVLIFFYIFSTHLLACSCLFICGFMSINTFALSKLPHATKNLRLLKWPQCFWVANVGPNFTSWFVSDSQALDLKLVLHNDILIAKFFFVLRLGLKAKYC